MKKKGISPEYKYLSIPGSFNMMEQKSFLGSKMIDIEDSIYMNNRDIVYYQQSNGEQIDLTQELNLSSTIYSIYDDKLENHLFGIDNSQTSVDKNNKTKWVIELNLYIILKNYIYANIKNSRTFENVRNYNTQTKSVNEGIKSYINNNIIDRYEFSDIEFFIKYIELSEDNTMRFKTNYNSNIELKENKFTNIRTIFTEDKSMVRIFFTQQESSKDFSFDYYFNVRFNKK